MGENENGTSTAVAVAEASKSPALEQIKQRGATAIAERKLLTDMYRMLEGVEWGVALSQNARGALAKFCVVTRANPQIHVDILGGKPRHNAQYYWDKVSADPYFIDADMLNISKDAAEQLRAQAKAAIAEAKEFDLPVPTEEVQGLLAQAREVERKRLHYGVPEWATHAYEAVCRRYTENAPLEAISRGEIDGEAFVRVVREANWAGGRNGADGRKDPIGDNEPAKTSRTRAARRCFATAFSAWFDAFEDEINKARQIVDAEFEIVQEDRVEAARQIPAGADDQVLRTGGGEAQGVSGREVSQQASQEAEQQQEQPFDVANARRALFATLRDAGIQEETRKQWAAENNLPPSTKDWGAAEFATAMHILLAPTREKIEQGCKVLGLDPDQISIEVAARPYADLTLRELNGVAAELGSRADAQEDL